MLSMIQSWTQYRHTFATFQRRSFEASSFPLAALWPCLPVLWRFLPLFLQRVEYIVDRKLWQGHLSFLDTIAFGPVRFED